MNKLADELHKPFINKFQRRRVIVTEKDEIFGADLVDMQEWSKENDDNKYILTVIDCFTKYAWAIPIKNKTAKSVHDAFEEIFKSGRICKKLWVDGGSEFYNNTLKKLLTKHNIELYSSYGDHKSAVVERFNRTLKESMWKKFTANNNRQWTNILEKLVNNYNNKKHRTIKMTPNEASQIKNEKDVLFNTTNFKSIKKVAPKLKVNDWVRISRVKGLFEKGYLPNWSREIFKVIKVLNTSPITYDIEEYDGSKIEGAFYEQELQKTELTNTFLVEEVLKTKKVKGVTMYFVKYLGWPKKYNAWITKDNLEDVK